MTQIGYVRIDADTDDPTPEEMSVFTNKGWVKASEINGDCDKYGLTGFRVHLHNRMHLAGTPISRKIAKAIGVRYCGKE